MSERCDGCAQLRLERDQAISVQEGLAKQLLLWQGDYESLAELYSPTDQVLGVMGLIAAIYAWHRQLLVLHMLEAAITAFMKMHAINPS